MVEVNIIGWLDKDEDSPVLMVVRVLPLYSLHLYYIMAPAPRGEPG